MANDTDVLIVGAGPTGLVLALWLHRLGVKLRIIDKAATPGETSRALAVHARTLELYDQVGLAEAVVAAGREMDGARLWVRGRQRARFRFGDVGGGLSPYPFAVSYPQDAHERLLGDRLAQAGIEVERPVELTGFETDSDGVTARLRRSDGSEGTIGAAYLAGCDGARSVVRETIKAGFPGGTYSRLFYVADVEAEGPVVNGELNAALDTADFLAVFPMRGEGRIRLVGDIEREEGAAELSFADVGQGVIERLALNIRRVNWFSTYRVHHRVADTWRAGRAFLLGDAAHIHSPVGGQGMNTGIGDAINLAWKLAAVLAGNAPPELLDTFEPERIAFARRLVASTDRAFTFISQNGPLARFVRLVLVPIILPAAFAVQAVRRLIFRSVSQINVNYRGMALSEGAAGKVRAGDRLPWTGEGGPDNFAPLKRLAWQGQVHGVPSADVTAACAAAGLALTTFPWSEAAARAGLARDAFHLVRPDGYLALVAANDAARGLAAYQALHGLKFGL
ncbi:MAG TPA: FAD-dependent monooxygenase [Caulobacteraceae bacterium]|jgi:2-polyprenyl-6-methoxyphenol hydroxylase-like FAD-dependent oxidoreductase